LFAHWYFRGGTAMGDTWLQILGILAFLVLMAGAVWAVSFLNGRRREILESTLSPRCPVCLGYGVLLCDRRERVPGTMRRQVKAGLVRPARGYRPGGGAQEAPVARYHYYWRCRHCGAERVEEREGPVGKAAGDAPLDCPTERLLPLA
jgi:hypothetical protein